MRTITHIVSGEYEFEYIGADGNIKEMFQSYGEIIHDINGQRIQNEIRYLLQNPGAFNINARQDEEDQAGYDDIDIFASDWQGDAKATSGYKRYPDTNQKVIIHPATGKPVVVNTFKADIVVQHGGMHVVGINRSINMHTSYRMMDNIPGIVECTLIRQSLKNVSQAFKILRNVVYPEYLDALTNLESGMIDTFKSESIDTEIFSPNFNDYVRENYPDLYKYAANQDRYDHISMYHIKDYYARIYRIRNHNVISVI